MKKLIVVFAIALSIPSKAQTVIRTVKANDKTITLESRLGENNLLDVTLKEDGENKGSFKVNPDQAVEFQKAVLEQLDPTKSMPADEKAKLSSEVADEFNATIQSLLAQAGKDAPKAGTLKTRRTVPYYNGYNDGESKSGNVEIKDIRIVFYDGFIQKIDVYGERTESDGTITRTRFVNKFGIGFNRDKNYRNLTRIALFDNNTASGSKGDYIKLGELLTYEPNTDLLTLDYSPADKLVVREGDKIVDVYREEFPKLIEGAIYTDLIGLSEDKPNGLIQTELSRKFNLVTSRVPLGKSNFLSSFGLGGLQYIRPAITFTKIEGKERRYKPMAKEFLSDSSNVTRSVYVRPLDVMEYQNLSLGVDQNLLVVDHANYMFYLNFGLRFNKTAVADSLSRIENNELVKSGNVEEYSLNYFTLYPELTLLLLPEKRVSFEMIYRLTYFAPAFDNVDLFRIEGGQNKFDTEKKYRWFHTFHAGLTLRTNDDNKIFARYRYNCELNNFTQSFHQLQLGYSFNLLAPKAKS